MTGPKDAPDEDKQREDEDLDEALEETFPASDPIAETEPGAD
jgi:hypothetical protein